MTAFTIADFVRESNRIEGIHRNPTSQEIEATAAFVANTTVSVATLERLVNVYAPGKPLRRSTGMNVRVGSHRPPPGGADIVTSLERLCRFAAAMHPYTLHCEYEQLHPFMDGNGRSGRALWLWRRHGEAPLGFLHHFYYESLEHFRQRAG